MNRLLTIVLGAFTIMTAPMVIAQDDAPPKPTDLIGGFAADDVLNDMQNWSFRQARKVVSDIANERMTLISLGVVRGESKAARFNIRGGDGLTALAGGLTFECKPSDADEDGFFKPLTDEEIADACDWVIWQYSLDEAEHHLRDVVFKTLDREAVSTFVASKGYAADAPFPAGRTDYKDVIDVYKTISENALKTEEYSLKSCESLGRVLNWFEGFKPTPVDIERFGEDVKYPAPTLTDQLYEAMIYSRVKGGFIEIRYSGYSGEPKEVAEFLTAGVAQCGLDSEAD